MGKVFIYALLDPDTSSIRYIGKALNLESRLYTHIREAKSGGNKYKDEWIRQLLEQNKSPLISQLTEVEESEVNDREKELIIIYQAAGANLLNMMHGGKNGKRIYRPESLERIRESNKIYGKWRTKQYRRPKAK